MALPTLSLHPAPEAQKKRFGRWLIEWEIDRDLRSMTDDASSRGPGDVTSLPPVAALSDEPGPAVGQIRLFSPSMHPAGERLFHVALLHSIDEASFVAAPYGRFSEPCLTTELLTNRDTPCLRVMCIWNTIRLSSDQLASSWVVDDLSREELSDAAAVLRHARSNDTLPDELVPRTGPPKWHPADPRNRYVEEEIAFNAAFLGGSSSARGLITYPEKDVSWPIAADPHGDYGTDPDTDPSDTNKE